MPIKEGSGSGDILIALKCQGPPVCPALEMCYWVVETVGIEEFLTELAAGGLGYLEPPIVGLPWTHTTKKNSGPLKGPLECTVRSSLGGEGEWPPFHTAEGS